MKFFLMILLLGAFAALVGTAVTAWHCMKLTRGETDEPKQLKKWGMGLAGTLVSLVILGGGYFLLSALTGVTA